MAFAMHLAAIPVIAGLVAGTGTIASHLVAPSPTPLVSPASAARIERPCAEQTWPYINQNCVGTASAAPRRKIRVVAAPSGFEQMSDAGSAAVDTSAAPAISADPALVTSDTVLRQQQHLAATGIDATDKQAASRPRAKRATQTQRRERRYVAQSYQVPVDGQYRAAETRPVIVVRPMSVEFVRPCDDRRC